MKQKIKANLKKILVIILIFFSLNNFFISNICVSNASISVGVTGAFNFAGNAIGGVVNILEELLNFSVVGLLTWPFRIIPMAIALGVDALTAQIAYIDNGEDDPTTIIITPFEIFFNKIKLLDINFFDIREYADGEDEPIINKIRKSVATWYYIMRNIAAAILLVILIYVGIRMAISTVASDKATYKKMLVDWACSLALIFLTQYIIIFTINVNQAILNAFEKLTPLEGSVSEVYVQIAEEAMGLLGGISAIACTVVYCILTIQTLGLLFSYFNRMVKIAFLIIISPLITLTYSIDKMGDGKAQALGNWLREFVFTVLIQPFHCVIYMCLIHTAYQLLVDPGEDKLVSAILAIFCILFVKPAENLVRKIFAFKDDNSKTSMAAGMAMSAAAFSQSKNIAKYARKGVNVAGRIKNNAGAGFRNAKADLLALAAAARSQGDGRTFSERKEEKLSELEEKHAQKQIDKLKSQKQKYNIVKDANGKISLADANLAKEVQAKMRANPEMSQARAAAIVRAEHAKKQRKKEKWDNVGNYIPTQKARDVWSRRGKIISDFKNSSTYSTIGKMKNFYMASGMALTATSFSMGAGNKVGQAFMDGATAYRATSEFNKSCTETIMNDVVNNLKALGVETSSQASNEIMDVLLSRDLFEDDDELKRLLQELKNQLLSAGISENLAESIKLDIQKNVKEGNVKGVDDIVKRALANNHITTNATNFAKIVNASNGISNFENRKSIYESYKNNVETAAIIDSDTFINTATSSFAYEIENPELNDVKNTVELSKERALDEDDLKDIDTDSEIEILKTMKDELDRMHKQQIEDEVYGVEYSYIEDEINNLEDNIEFVEDDVEVKKKMDRALAQMETGFKAEFELQDIVSEINNLNMLIHRGNLKIDKLQDDYNKIKTQKDGEVDQSKVNDLNNHLGELNEKMTALRDNIRKIENL